MSKKVDRWLLKGLKNCAEDRHWFILNYGSHLVCPVCGKEKKPEDGIMEEYNGYLVQPVLFKKG